MAYAEAINAELRDLAQQTVGHVGDRRCGLGVIEHVAGVHDDVHRTAQRRTKRAGEVVDEVLPPHPPPRSGSSRKIVANVGIGDDEHAYRGH